MANSSIIIKIDSDDLIQILDNPSVKQKVANIFESILDKKLKSINAQEAVLDFGATLKFLGIKQGTLYKWTSEGIIPHNKPGGKLFFIREDLIQWIKSGKVKISSELDDEAEKYVSTKIKGGLV